MSEQDKGKQAADKRLKEAKEQAKAKIAAIDRRSKRRSI